MGAGAFGAVTPDVVLAAEQVKRRPAQMTAVPQHPGRYGDDAVRFSGEAHALFELFRRH